MTPEQEARVNINRLLEQAGWSVQNADSINLCICSELDSVVDSFLGRPLDGGPLSLPVAGCTCDWMR